jgi:heterodisulfide reductase subunit A-like polyferredoxin/coenzyme F420-reducing hydrogenase delta subunit
VGLYLSRCRGCVSDVVDLDALAREFEPEVTLVRVVDDILEPAAQQLLERDVAEHELDGVVIVGNSVDYYLNSLSGRLLSERLVSVGVNPNHVVYRSTLEQVANPHAGDPEGAMRKARALIRTGLLRVRTVASAESKQTVPRRSVLVLGATEEGLVAAQRLLQLGYEVILADRGEPLTRLSSRDDLGATRGYVVSHPRTELLGNCRIVDALGWVGDYEFVFETEGETAARSVGGVLLAEPDEMAWVAELRNHFKVDVDDEGHARSLDPEKHPAETIEPGIMVTPKEMADGQLSSHAAAADSAAMALVLQLSQPATVHWLHTSKVDENLCGGCASCVKTCAFGACFIDPNTGVSHVDSRRCRGCGKCVVSCPVGARDIVDSPHDYVVGAIESLAETEVEGPKVLGFLCSGCGYPAADRAGEVAKGNGHTYPASFLPLRIPCGGRLDAQYVLEAYRAGFDGISVFRCREGHCHNLIGNLDMDRRINLLREVLRSRNLDDARLRIVDISPEDGEGFIGAVNDLYATISDLADGKGER